MAERYIRYFDLRSGVIIYNAVSFNVSFPETNERTCGSSANFLLSPLTIKLLNTSDLTDSCRFCEFSLQDHDLILNGANVFHKEYFSIHMVKPLLS